METIYRKQSFLEYDTHSSGKINYDMVSKNINREYFIEIKEEL